ncbi:G patch domain-containing protein TGH [Apium graveolens]|uniref:G patch domain-containing protein TGH n=1 Tax=Apium graveolens TaxID=4045 RepID=UPI003D7A6E39
MDVDEDDFVFFGTPIEREDDVSTTRKKKAVAEASGQLRTLVPWKQEVRDEEGRRRFHGAFSGGFSAGYYNTVGSKEGWTPQTFTSSRKNRAEIKKQSILSFLDEDEKAELDGESLGTSSQFDTFGSTAAEIARKQAEKEQQQRPSAIPGPAPDEIVLPASDSIGVSLLLKMGWRRGRSIKDSRPGSLYDVRREARKAFLALSSEDVQAPISESELVRGDPEKVSEIPTGTDNQLFDNTPVYVLKPKQDMHGLGFDPFKNAPEFRERKRARVSEIKEVGQGKSLSTKNSLFGFKSERIAPGFGIGALEELDAEDEDVYSSGYDFGGSYVQEIGEPTRLFLEDSKKKGEKEHGVLHGFKVASVTDYQTERFNPPEIPKDFVPRHVFSAPLEDNYKLADLPPPEVPPPGDKDLKVLIEGVATLVSRCGKLFEDLSREKNQSNPLFSFLNGGDGHQYYFRKLWEENQKRNDHSKQLFGGKLYPTEQKMTAESRGKILGEKPLEKSSRNISSPISSGATVNLQVNLSDTFTTPVSFAEPQEVAKPFRDDPPKQTRFEQYLKEKYRGGLRSKESGGSSYMSEADRARERLEFEAAAVAIEKGKWGNEMNLPDQQLVNLSGTTGLQFTSGGTEQAGVTKAEEELITKKLYPKREEFQWRPASILCKRFDLIDPYMGKPPPAPRTRSKMDSLIFMPDLLKDAKPEENAGASLSQSKNENNNGAADREDEVEVEVENVERPVDLYKAIFSDDSDDEIEDSGLDKVEHQQKNADAANTTLSRLIAGDFLESLGKELGLEVPPELSKSEHNSKGKEAINIHSKDSDSSILSFDRKSSIPSSAIDDGFKTEKVRNDNIYHAEVSHDDASRGALGNSTQGSGSQTRGTGLFENVSVRSRLDVPQETKKGNTSTGQQDRSSASSDDERTRRSSKSRRRKSRYSEGDTTDSSDDYEDRHRSRSRGRKNDSSREKSSSRKHSKHHKHRSRRSPSSSHHRSRKDHRDSKREKRK